MVSVEMLVDGSSHSGTTTTTTTVCSSSLLHRGRVCFALIPGVLMALSVRYPFLSVTHVQQPNDE